MLEFYKNLKAKLKGSSLFIYRAAVIMALTVILVSLNIKRNAPVPLNGAYVKKYTDLYLFIDCEPANGHIHLADLKITSANYKEALPSLYDQAKQISGAQGIVINETTASVIKFK